MTRKAKISFLILVWSIVAVQIFVNYQQKIQKEREAITAFSVVENDVIEEVVAGYGYFGKMELSDETKEQMLKNLADKLEIHDSYDINSSTGEDYKKQELSYRAGTTEMILQIVSMEVQSEKLAGKDTEPDSGTEQYILMNIRTKDSVKQGKAYFDMVKRIYDEIGVRATVNMEIVMENKGNLLADAEKKTEELWNILHASEVKRINENGIYTVYGYRKEEDSYLMYKGEKTNVQLVMTYDEEHDKTYTKVGIPIVNSAY